MKKINQFLMIVILLFLGLSTQATPHTIQAGLSNGFTFTPNSLTTVVVGDVIHFVRVSGSHTTASDAIPVGAASWNQNLDGTTTTFDYTVTVAGSYTYHCGNHGSMTGSFTVSAVAPIFTKTSLVYNSFEISPNPTSELLTIKFSSDQYFRANLLVFDGSGKEKINKQVEIITGDNNHSFPLTSLPKGTYYLIMVEGETSFISKKFIKE